ncbi:polysaccharide biosynthesis/export family protein [Sphingomonas sp. CROZ-RG-20F-R02-07]|uniref:polysaccharide biosynthesis/export family protein n=1 Tax=Sphingomonas sp. CROZ-RG-20F-R02-07 TaxID=2914832 RepID=UPI001F5603D2|nr:polysaccharide biosynthesis/export family protein [Sphingomonas sp. CROZ-RG-20F-R02-07]
MPNGATTAMMAKVRIAGAAALLACAGSAGAQAGDAYRIGPGDEVSVTFPYNPELDHAGPVGPDGRFAIPIVGNVALGGRTIDETAALISATLRREGVVEDARPTVAIRQYGAVVYVGGEVKTPGAVKLNGSLDPLQAVISAGGALETAKSKRIVVIHRNSDGTIVQSYADLRAYAHGGVGTGIALRPQDIVFVPRSSIAEADLWIDQHINKLLPFSRSLNYSLGTNAVIGR